MGTPETSGTTRARGGLRFRLLGPVQVLVDDRPVPLGGSGARGLLAMLLLEPNQVVGLDRIVDVLWAHEPPESARTMVQGYVSRLRQRLASVDPSGQVRIVTNPPGYQLLIDEQLIDVTVARQLVADAWGAPAVRRAELLRAAQNLWRGPALADIGGRVRAPELAELRLTVLEGRIEADLELGRHNEVIGELTGLVEEHPFRERLVGQLLLALYRSGRRTAALGAYQRFAQLAASHSGIEPGPALRALHARVLRDDTTLLDPQAESTLSPRVGVVVPAQLPMAPAGFCGRELEQDWLDRLLAGMDKRTTAVALVAGPPGIGKTALTVRWANQVATKFPDGHIFAGLRGFDPRHPPADPAEVLAQFLLALGVRPDDVPMDLDERAALYRSLLAERRVLVVLDDARDSDQVRPLLPGGTSSSLVLITSRVRLDGLVAGLAARLLVLDTLEAATAERLIEETAGTPIKDTDREHAARLAELCGHLPLALRIVGARLAARPQWSLADLAGELADEHTRLGALDVEGADTSVRAALDVTYRALRPTLAGTLRLAGMFPGSWLGPYSTAALCGTDLTEARRRLRGLAESFMVTEVSPDMFVMHDLVRIYAAELAGIELADDERAESLRRLLRYYLVTAAAARRLLNPAAAERELDRLDHRQVPGPSLDTAQQAAGWLEREWTNLVAVAEAGSAAGAQDDLVRLARIVSDLSSGSRGLTAPLIWLAGFHLAGV
ncbi:MAG TPA: BTAD domain-containing putative transcriptional regulator [Actinophytocola sp.]|uniref:AfsR/SARP family transcriptional regulator n=1 Tax=Actinophytocola sp. TaxID=1872138 RepID=UPI002DB849BA|nr:BTAD domain-containing putative transcriptional regulator [Actinophytocola sp.]HEU5471742.1 BTAD domain-containing putative transcriptional regulator [Actinophytocola sp.]